MRNFNFVSFSVLSFFSTFVFALSAAASNNLEQVCEKDLKKKTAFYESTKKTIQTKMAKMSQDSQDWQEFEDSDQYDWIRFTVAKSLPAYANPHHKDICAFMYADFATEKRPLASKEKFNSWKNCLTTTYKDVIPEMAQRLLDCHAGVAQPTPKAGKED